MKHLLLWYCRLLVVSLFFGCGNPQVADGGGSDYPNGITGTAILASGHLAVGARAALIAVDSLHSTIGFVDSSDIQSSVTCDSLGRFIFDSVSPGLYRIEFLSNDTLDAASISCTKSMSEETTLDTVDLAPVVHLHGYFTPGSPIPSALYIAGSPYKANIDTVNRAFEFPPLPAFEYRMVTLSESGSDTIIVGSLIPSPGQSLVLDTLNVEATNLLLYDFEGDDMRNQLGGVIWPSERSYAGGWFSSVDVAWGGTSSLTPTGFDNDPLSAVESNGAKGKRCLHLFMKRGASFLDTGGNTIAAFVVAGFNIGDTMYDLSLADSISFMARGSGAFRFTATVAGFDNGTDGSFCTDQVLSAMWQKIVIPVSNLQAPAGSISALQGRQWSTYADEVSSFLFISTSATLDIYLDDIRLHGPRARDLLQ